MCKDDLLTLIPIIEYQAPDLPTLEKAEAELLKKMPSRWKKKALIAAAAGILGTTALTGCSVIENITPNRTIYCPDLHHGGAGGGPIYIVHLTEQEAVELIRNQLAEVGLNLNEVSPTRAVTINDVYVDSEWDGEVFRVFRDDVGMQLLDEENQVGVVAVNRSWDWGLGSACTIETSQRIVDSFLDEHGTQVGVFFRRSEWVGWFDGGDDEVSEEEKVEARERIEDHLTEQVQNFIAQLREEGVIE